MGIVECRSSNNLQRSSGCRSGNVLDFDALSCLGKEFPAESLDIVKVALIGSHCELNLQLSIEFNLQASSGEELVMVSTHHLVKCVNKCHEVKAFINDTRVLYDNEVTGFPFC